MIWLYLLYKATIRCESVDMPKTFFCRNCDTFASVCVEQSNPIQFSCGCVVPDIKERVSTPRSKQANVSWEQAIENIVVHIHQQKENANHVGLVVDDATFRRGHDWMRSLVFAVQIGTTSFFTPQCRYDAPRLLVTEWMIGHAAPLLSDLGRAHYILHVGSNPLEAGWGILQPDHHYAEDIEHSRKTKKTKYVAMHPHNTKSSVTHDDFLQIRPGTEAFLFLGMLHVIIQSGWYDAQFVEKYTNGITELQELLLPFSVERCAQICGISEVELSGTALKWSRSAMGLIHPNPGCFSNEHATLGAWAWLCLHAVTANILRPGALYESLGAIDIMPFLSMVHTSSAPKNTVGGQPLLIMQNMSSQLLEMIEKKEIKVLIVAAEELFFPQKDRLYNALGQLELLVVISTRETELTRIADIVLPRTTVWEEDDILVHRNTTMPFRSVPVIKAQHPITNDSKALWSILETIQQGLSKKQSIFGTMFSSFSEKTDWGRKNRMLAMTLQQASVEKWIHRTWEFLHETPLQEGYNDLGDSNRASWRPQNDRIVLVPRQITEILRGFQFPTISAEYPLFLQTGDYVQEQYRNESNSVVIHMHSSLGKTEGSVVELHSPYGKIDATVHNDDTVRTDSVVCSFWKYPQILNLVPSKTDPYTGTPILNGVVCRIG